MNNKHEPVICRLTNAEWNDCLCGFEDASIYQTVPYAEAWLQSGSAEHIGVRRGDETVAACQLAVRRLPLGMRVAYVVWGPLWRRRSTQPDFRAYKCVLEALKTLYGLQRGYLLRVWPCDTGASKVLAADAFSELGYKPRNSLKYRTLRLDLRAPLPDLRANLIPRWRTSLNKAERNGLLLSTGTGDEFFETFGHLSRECQERKGFRLEMDVGLFRRAQTNLLPDHRLQFVECCSNGEPVCSAAYSAIGDTAVYILGATGEKGYGCNAAYLVQWKIIEELKTKGVKVYDLGGVDPEGNPGVYRFKAGLVGKSGVDEQFLGELVGMFATRARIANRLLDVATRIRRRKRNRIGSKDASPIN